jgi:hypothetical protein
MEQTVMVFADAAARTTALTGVVSEGMISYLKDTNAVEVYNGSAWVASDDPNAIQNTIVDAKGDLITATAADTPARLAVGSNGDTLVADSAATTGLRYTAGVGLVNPVINGAFDVWQRGTSVAGSGSAYNYTADRWQMNAVADYTVSRQATGDTTNLANVQYCARVQRNNASTATTAHRIIQNFETVNSIPYAGKTITLSFYARAGANYSSASSILNADIFSGTGTDQNRGVGGYTGSATVLTSTSTLTTTWQRFSYTGTVAATATELAIFLYYTPVGTAGANDYFEVTGVQIDIGNVALPFRRSGGTIQGELAACQRYYFRTTAGTAFGTVANYGYAKSSTEGVFSISAPVTMRVAPTSVDFGNVAFVNYADSVFGLTSITLNANGNAQNIVGAGTISGATTGHTGRITGNNNTAGFLGFNAEL